MAKLTVLYLIYIILAAASVTSSFASRPMPTRLQSADLAKSDTVALPIHVMSSTNNRKTDAVADVGSTQFQASSPTNYKEFDQDAVEHEGIPTNSDEEEFDDEMGPCVDMELGVEQSADHEEHTSSEAGRSCHRMLGDYSPGANRNRKGSKP